VPAAGVGFQSRILQIETARVFGDSDYKRFDTISVSLPHPDATAALIAAQTEIDAHYSSPPFQYQALEYPNIHKVLSSYDTLGGHATFNVLYTTQKFHDENPQTYRAFYDALGKPPASSTATRMPLPRPISAWNTQTCHWR
jgi:NitT/TauT family transport system substrate-binding protein